jgi:hypothetical protein
MTRKNFGRIILKTKYPAIALRVLGLLPAFLGEFGDPS